MPIRSVTVRVPGKVNLQLSVGPCEDDGFHNLVTVFQAISIFDDLTMTLAQPHLFTENAIVCVKVCK